MNFRKIKSRLVLYTASLILVSIIFVSGIMTTIFTNELLRNLKVITDQDLQIVNFTLEEELKNIYSTFISIQEREDLQELLAQVNKGDNSYELTKQISDIIREYAYSDVSITSIFILDLDGNVLDPLYLLEPYSDIIRNYEPLNDYMANHNGIKFSKPSSFPSKLEDEQWAKKNISYFDQLLSNENYEPLGTIVPPVSSILHLTLLSILLRKLHNKDGSFLREKNNIGILLFLDAE